MQTQRQHAPAAIKVECQSPTLTYVMKYLVKEQTEIAAELETMEPDAWLNARGRALANREQELHTTLAVLRGLTRLPVQIQEPEAVAG